MGEFCAWHRSYPSKVYRRVDQYLSGGFKPEYQTNRKNSLATFSLQLQDRSYDNILELKTGDDIVITTDATGNTVKESFCMGKINELGDVTIGSMEPPDENGNCRYELIQPMTIEQRDFSGFPFEINKTFPIMLSAVLSEIFQEYVRSDLGGIIGGVTIPRFFMLCPDVELANYTFRGIAKEHLIESVNNRASLKWRLDAYSESNEINGLNTCYQVVIYA